MNKQIEMDLLVVLEQIQQNLRSKNLDSFYDGVSKSANILKNRDRNGYKKVQHHLLSDFKILYDNRHDSDVLNNQFDKACKLSEELT